MHTAFALLSRCICLFSYIKPQPPVDMNECGAVVYVSFPTSNHNPYDDYLSSIKLYMSLFLHQTTTMRNKDLWRTVLYMSLFLHQTTTIEVNSSGAVVLYMSLFLHQTTTMLRYYRDPITLYMSLFLHQTTTSYSA